MILELERFITVVKEGSITKASQKLFITQPALSQAIERLEKDIGVKLFKRIGRKLVLTDNGEVIYQTSEHILRLWKNIKDPLMRKRGVPLPHSLGLFDNAALKLSSFFQKQLQANQFLFEITIDRSAFLIRGMQQGIYDVCVCILPPQKNWVEHVLLVKTFSEKLYPVSGTVWKKTNNEIPFILYNKDSETRHYIDKTFLENGVEPNVIVESTSPVFMKELAISGAGVALLPKNFIERELQQKKLVIHKLPFVFYRNIGLFINKESKINASDQIIRDMIKNI